MKVYLAYAWEYMDAAHLVGVYFRYDVAQQHAKEAADEMDAINKAVFDKEELQDIRPAMWMTLEKEVLES